MIVVKEWFDIPGYVVVIVLIRSFLTVTLELEIEGRWPRQRIQIKR